MVDGASQGAISSYTFSNVTANQTISAAFELLTYTLTINSPCGLSTTGSESYNAGSTATATVTLTEVSGGSDTKYLFTGWSGDAGGTTTSINIVVNSPKTVTANCKTQYWLTVNSSYGLATTGSGWYDAGQQATACVYSTTLPGGGSGEQYVLTIWSGAASGSTACVNVTMNGPKTVTANYQRQYYLHMSSSGPCGTVSPSGGWYNEGDAVEKQGVG